MQSCKKPHTVNYLKCKHAYRTLINKRLLELSAGNTILLLLSVYSIQSFPAGVWSDLQILTLPVRVGNRHHISYMCAGERWCTEPQRVCV